MPWFLMLGIGDKDLEQVPITKHHHHHYHRYGRHRHHDDEQKEKVVVTKDVPKGYLPIKVGQGEEQQKIVVPVMYLNHPLFSQLLKEAEEEYGFDQQGTIIIPCHLEEFRYIQELIDRENNNNNKSPQHQYHHHVVGCFKGSSQQDQV